VVFIVIILFIIIFFILFIAQRTATCVLGQSATVRGTLFVTQLRRGVRITGRVTGLSPGLHGMHIHEFGDFDDGCASFGGHYNPANVNHGMFHIF